MTEKMEDIETPVEPVAPMAVDDDVDSSAAFADPSEENVRSYLLIV